jgi:hypothetical protein
MERKIRSTIAPWSNLGSEVTRMPITMGMGPLSDTIAVAVAKSK